MGKKKAHLESIEALVVRGNSEHVGSTCLGINVECKIIIHMSLLGPALFMILKI